eukprot:TRINITY_DN298_c0_g2_i3.p1 TRINITY_DN298_c0_g2~~TRINITY_DN298_c0_g2_i3.p1  ORF type:complete len:416 (-),score=34.50 TRINITY_DN298_c0_g2_i3:226-1473(-)
MKPEKEDEPKEILLGKVFFVCAGISALSAWNGVITALDYFDDQYQGRDVFFEFPIPFNISKIVAPAILFGYSNALSLKKRTLFGLVGTIFLMISLPLIAQYVSTDISYYIMSPILYLLGTLNCLFESSMTGLATILPAKYISLYFMGTGFCGLFTALLRMICLAIFSGSSKKSLSYSTMLFFSAACIFNTITLFLYFQFKKTPYCKFFLGRFLKSIRESFRPPSGIEQLLDHHTPHEPKSISSEWRLTWKASTKIAPLPLTMIILYVQTISMYPSISMTRKISFLDKSWSPLVLITTYNLFDTIGKYIADFRSIYGRCSIFTMVFLRFVFYPIFLAMTLEEYIPIITADWFHLLAMALFAVSNGIGTTALLTFAQESSEVVYREKTGFVMIFGLYIGMVIGSTFTAALFQGLPFV